MAKIDSLVAKLRTEFPSIRFEESDDFYWSPTTGTVYFQADTAAESSALLLHETAHAVLGHEQFRRDIDLLKIERQAWDYVQLTLGPRFAVAVDKDTVEDMIDTYRDWLHARSSCPVCSLTGVQTEDHTYHCVGCDHDWKVNDARRCGLKRYSLTN